MEVSESFSHRVLDKRFPTRQDQSCRHNVKRLPLVMAFSKAQLLVIHLPGLSKFSSLVPERPPVAKCKSNPSRYISALENGTKSTVCWDWLSGTGLVVSVTRSLAVPR